MNRNKNIAQGMTNKAVWFAAVCALVVAMAASFVLAAMTPSRALAAGIDSLDVNQVYSTSGTVPAEWQEGTFTYELQAKDGAPLPAGANGGAYTFTITGTNSTSIALATGSAADSSAISFNTVGVYYYTLQCVTQPVEGLWMDGNTFEIAVTVENDQVGNGIHVASLVVKDNQGAKPDKVEFDPSYKGEEAPAVQPDDNKGGETKGGTFLGLDLPETGDPLWGMMLFSGILLAAAVVAIVVSCVAKRRKNESD